MPHLCVTDPNRNFHDMDAFLVGVSRRGNFSHKTWTQSIGSQNKYFYFTLPYLYQYYRTIHIDPTHTTSSDRCVGSPHFAICIVINTNSYHSSEYSNIITTFHFLTNINFDILAIAPFTLPFSFIIFLMSHSTHTGSIHPIDDEAAALIETADPDDQSLSSDSRRDRDIREIITELRDQVCFFGTRILALEERAILGGTIFVPSADIMPPIIPEPTSSIIPNPTGTTSHPVHHPEPISSGNPTISSGTHLTFSELIGDFLPC
jgi:hypothetical protein